MSNMFCFQCQQTAGNKACVNTGVCGKQPSTSNLQDELICELIRLAEAAELTKKSLQQKKETDPKLLSRYLNTRKSADRLLIDGLFTTLTNVNFDDKAIKDYIKEVQKNQKDIMRCMPTDICSISDIAYKNFPTTNMNFSDTNMNSSTANINPPTCGLKDPHDIPVISLWDGTDDIVSLRSTLLFGLKGMAAYAHHAMNLGYQNDNVTTWFYKGLCEVNREHSVEEWIELIMEFGKVNYQCMELLDKANTESFGTPTPTKVHTDIRKGPFIVVSGHDLRDLDLLLKQTEGTGVNVYTHCEMLPAHGYPKLAAYKHLAGNFGTAWQSQQTEFENIPAPVLFTTNCLMPPRGSHLHYLCCRL